MSDPVARTVVNVDALWGADARWYRFGDVSLGERGVPQTLVFSAAAGVACGWLASALPLLHPGFWPTGVLVAVLVAASGLLRPSGLRVHQFLPVVARHLTAARHLHGWSPCRPPLDAWRPSALALEGDGSRAQIEDLDFTGPGLLVCHRPIAGRKARGGYQLVVGGRGSAGEGRELEVPAGVTVRVRREGG